MTDRGARTPYLLCALVGLGGLFFGVTGPLLSNFIPPMVRSVLGEERTLIGAVLALDNVIMFLLVPWSGALSDRFRARGRGRLPIILAGLVLAAVGMAVLPSSPALGLAGLLGAMVVLYAGINLMRAPFQALVADLVPSRFRSLATGSVTFQMCVGAIVFLMLGRVLGMRPAFLIAGALRARHRPRLPPRSSRAAGAPREGEAAEETTFRALFGALGAVVRGTVPGLRAIFMAALLLQVTFQGFASWYVLHGTERFGGRPGGHERGLHRLGDGRRRGRAPRRLHRRAPGPPERDARRLRADGGELPRPGPRHEPRRPPRRCWPWPRPPGPSPP